MMKIHTTQNLNSQGRLKSTNNMNIPNEEIRLNYSEYLRKQKSLSHNDVYESSHVSFKGKKQIIEKAEEKLKKVVDKEKFKYKIFRSGLFNNSLDLMGGGQEVLMQAAISFGVCCLMRPLTIMALPAKDKDNNKYASAHSISSGIVGIIASIILAAPFAKGLKYAQKKLLQYVEPKYLNEMFPHLNVDSIKDAAGKAKPIEEWLDKTGNKFSNDTKNVMMAAKPKSIEVMSESTLKELGVDVDVAAMQGKRASEWVTRNGEKLRFNPKDMFIEVSEEGMGQNYFSLGLADKKFLGEVFETLDVNTIEKEGKRINPLDWKNKDGSQFMPNLLDNVYVSSLRETKEVIPIYSGTTRTTPKGKTKYCAYQRNIAGYSDSKVPEKLGTEITQEMLDADNSNTVKYKALTWIPDILTRVFVASATIKLIPTILKKVFHLEKKKKAEPEQNDVAAKNAEIRKVAA